MAVNESAFAPTSSNLRPGRDFSEEEKKNIVEEYNDMQLMHSPAFLCEKYNTDIAFIRNLLKSSRRPARHFSDEEKKIIAEEYDVHSHSPFFISRKYKTNITCIRSTLIKYSKTYKSKSKRKRFKFAHAQKEVTLNIEKEGDKFQGTKVEENIPNIKKEVDEELQTGFDVLETMGNGFTSPKTVPIQDDIVKDELKET